jgi:phage baseplate assembly protein W
MATLDFKNVGTKITDGHFTRRVNKETTVPFGFKTPLRLSDTAAHPFDMHYRLEDQIHDNLRNLLLTNWGERVGLYFFGANLYPLLFDLTAVENFEMEAAIRIKTAVERYMPWVQLSNMQTEVETLPGDNVAKIALVVTYSIERLNIVDRSLKLVFHMGG